MGNFLAEILERKLRVVKERYRKSQLEFERNAVLAVSSVYGIDKACDLAAVFSYGLQKEQPQSIGDNGVGVAVVMLLGYYRQARRKLIVKF